MRGRGGRSLPSANPDNVAAGGATDPRCGGEGGEEGWRGTDNSSWQPLFVFLLVFLSAVRPGGFDEKILLSTVQYRYFITFGVV